MPKASILEESNNIKAIRRQKKRPRMKVSGASVKKLSRLIKVRVKKH